MNRLWIAFALAAAVTAIALVQPSARAADTGCRKWEVRLFPMKPEHESAVRAGKPSGSLAVEEGWEPFGMAFMAVAARRCAP
jgi:hypothetical protein